MQHPLAEGRAANTAWLILTVVQKAPMNINNPDDEAAAMAAMFEAQTANWEEAQEKMSQLVSRASALFVPIVEYILMNFVYFLSSRAPLSCHSATRIYNSNNPRGTPRGGKPFQPSHHHSDRPLPPSYVCYRCGQKGALLSLFCVLPMLTAGTLKVIGSKTARRTTTANSTTGHGSSARLVSRVASSRQSIIPPRASWAQESWSRLRVATS